MRTWLVVFFVGSLSNYVDACRMCSQTLLFCFLFFFCFLFSSLGSPLFWVKACVCVCVRLTWKRRLACRTQLFFIWCVFFFFPFSFLNKLDLFISLTFVQFAVHLTRHLVGAYGNLVMYCILFILFFCVLCAYCILYYCPVPVPILFTMCVCHVALHPSIHLGAEGEWEEKRAGICIQ